MNIIITEKPSVAEEYAKALNLQRYKDRWQGEEYIVVTCVGHLLELYDPEDYDLKYKNWEIKDLPILPGDFKYKIKDGVKKYWDTIQATFREYPQACIIAATDAGREGEVIVRTVLNAIVPTYREKTVRVWSSAALTKEEIKKAIDKAKPIREYEKLYESGRARQICDWMLGINITRYMTLVNGALFSVGRVQTAVLKQIYDRECAIKKHVAEKYYKLRLDILCGIEVIILYYKKDGKYEHEKSMLSLPIIRNNVLSKKETPVTIIKEEKIIEKPTRLYDITTLQKEANSLFHYTAAQTLAIVQVLYEKYKCCSYPRTPSRYMGEEDVEYVRSIVEDLKGIYRELFEGIEEKYIDSTNGNVFCQAKVIDHHALLPIRELPSGAREEERNVYKLLLKSLARVFRPCHEYQRLEIEVQIDKEIFATIIRHDTISGWRSYEKTEKEEGEEERCVGTQTLDLLREKNTHKIKDCRIEEHDRRAAKHYTDATLLGMMEKYELGTSATRAGIVEVLMSRMYCKRNEGAITILEKGEHLIETMNAHSVFERILDCDETGKWEIALEERPSKVVADTKEYIMEAMNQLREVVIEQFVSNGLGQCPICKKGVIVAGSRAYYCTEKPSGCELIISKMYLGACVTEKDVIHLLEGKHTRKLKMKGKDGKVFEARLRLVGNKVKFEYPN